MQSEHKKCPYEFSFEETEEGFAVRVKGDKGKLKAKLEAIEAYHKFREKAKEAGFLHHRRPNCSHGFLSLIHKHLQLKHKHKHKSSESEAAE